MKKEEKKTKKGAQGFGLGICGIAVPRIGEIFEGGGRFQRSGQSKENEFKKKKDFLRKEFLCRVSFLGGGDFVSWAAPKSEREIPKS